MNKKEVLIEKIRGFDEKYFNEDQKNIAIRIIESAPEKEAQSYADFIFMKRRTGFAFDYSPEIAKGRLITLKEDISRRINVTDDIFEDENKLIIGDNYNALKTLLITHKEKIDVIYIDPPYNTESAKDDGNQSSKEGISSKFIYKDKFGRGGWLNMMKARLTLAKDLLSPEGAVFVSIDDSEQAYLKVLMDDIFGEENFIANMPRITRKGGKASDSVVSEFDYLLIYSKNKDLNSFGKIEFEGQNYKISDKHLSKRGLFQFKPLDVTSLGYVKSLDYEIMCNGEVYVPGKNKEIFKKRENGEIEQRAPRWRWSKEMVEFGIKNDFLFFKNGRVYTKIYRNVVISKTKPYEIINRDTRKSIGASHFMESKFSNFDSKKELESILGIGLFDYPKPSALIKEILKAYDNKSAKILDFFAGSGTTGQAVMKLNKEDGGNRKFILCTNNESNIAHNVTFERLHRIIKGEGTSGEKDFSWIEKNEPYSGEKLRVIDIDDQIKISLDENIDDVIYKNAKLGLKLLDGKYNKSDLNLYYDLAALNPLENDEDKD